MMISHANCDDLVGMDKGLPLCSKSEEEMLMDTVCHDIHLRSFYDTFE